MQINWGSTSVLVQGYNLNALLQNIIRILKSFNAEDRLDEFLNRAWENVVIGDFKTGRMGRATTGMWLALKNKAPKLIFGTGATCMIEDSGKIFTRQEWVDAGEPKVIWESEYTLRWLFNNFDKFKAFPKLWAKILEEFPNDPSNPDVLKNSFMQWLYNISTTDSISYNTKTEVEEALKISYEMAFLDGIIRITNPCHLPRSMSSALEELETFEEGRVSYGPKDFAIYGHPCQTDFKKDGAPLFIGEPMSGPPTPDELSFGYLHANEVMNGYWGLSPKQKQKLLRMNKEFIQKHTK